MEVGLEHNFVFEHAHEKQVRKRVTMEELLKVYDHFCDTRDVPIPQNPIEQIIGQSEAVKIAFVAAKQRRNLLLVAPPGTGKSLLAQAIAYHLPKPAQEINVLHNPEAPERPIVEIRTQLEMETERKLVKQMQGKLVSPSSVPTFVSERLGFRCKRCAKLSSAKHSACDHCGADKFVKEPGLSPFGDLLSPYFDEQLRQERVHTTKMEGGKSEEVIVYERVGEQIRILDQKMLEKIDSVRKKTPRKTIVPLVRKTFVAATGASETELLGDVRHDPYGGHHSIGTPPYQRVVPGAIHEAHEGVLFIDEISSLSFVQRFLLTAMQEKKYAIVGKNPNSSGASVKVESVPCDFILIAASNINDLQYVLPPLRSRILGNGYEILLETTMPDVVENRAKLCQFVAQEVRKDNRIPHASREAVFAIVEEAKKKAKTVDGTDGALTLRLRELSGIIHLAGDIAKAQGEEAISRGAVELAAKRSKNIEQQLSERYGSLYKAQKGDFVANNESVRDGKEIN